MPEKKVNTLDMVKGNGSTVSADRDLVKRLTTLSGMDAINSILAQNHPGAVVRDMSRVDLFWLVKRVGEEDSVPILQLASDDQRQYLLDMELWKRDRIDQEKSFLWLERLFNADKKRLAAWMYRDDNMFPYYYFHYNLHVIIKDDSDERELPKEYITFDNIYFIKILDDEHKDVIENILRTMAELDYNRFQALLLGVIGTIPAEIEEEMYRLRGVRLAEDGYLPFDEAISVYSYLKADDLKAGGSQYSLNPPDDETGAMVPITPIIYAQGQNLMTQIMDRIIDPAFLDRLRLEFGGLCNQIMSADGIIPDSLEVLKDLCIKTAGFINLGLERLSEGRLDMAEEFVRNNPLISLFRAGFSLALELKWEAERWMKRAWYLSHALEASFWGDDWEGLLSGLTLPKPRLYTGLDEDREYKDFENIAEIQEGRTELHRIILLDKLLESITSSPADIKVSEILDPISTFHTLIFTYWARKSLGLEPSVAAISIGDTRRFFMLLREGEDEAPFQMQGFKDVFIDDLADRISGLSPDDSGLMKETLLIIWEQFVEEYALMKIVDLDARFIKFLSIK